MLAASKIMYFCWSGQLHICFGKFDPSGYSCHRPQELGCKGLKSSSVEVGRQRMSERKKQHRPLTFPPGSCAVAFLPLSFNCATLQLLVVSSEVKDTCDWHLGSTLLFCDAVLVQREAALSTAYIVHVCTARLSLEVLLVSMLQGFAYSKCLYIKVSTTFIQSKFVRALWSSYCRKPADQLSRRSHRSIWKSWIAMESQTEGLRCCLTDGNTYCICINIICISVENLKMIQGHRLQSILPRSTSKLPVSHNRRSFRWEPGEDIHHRANSNACCDGFGPGALAFMYMFFNEANGEAGASHFDHMKTYKYYSNAHYDGIYAAKTSIWGDRRYGAASTRINGGM